MTDTLFVTDRPALEAAARRLRSHERVAIDTESASFHRYVDRVYLVQASSDDETVVIDPLAIDGLDEIGAILADPSTETIFHDADYDLRSLDRDYGFRATALWDTRIAAQLAGEPGVGLGTLLESHFGITLSKKLQRADWSLRPLTPDMLEYAAADTAYLPKLRDLLAEKLREQGRLHWAEEEFARLEGIRWAAPDDEFAFLRLKGAKRLPREALGVLYAVWQWRDQVARELDRAPFRVLGNDSIVELAKGRPESPNALSRVKGVTPAVVRRHGVALWDAIVAGRDAKPALPTRPPRARRTSDPDVEWRFERLRALRAERAAATKLEPGQLCPNATLQAIARSNGSTEGLEAIAELRRWQREVLGDDRLRAAMAR